MTTAITTTASSVNDTRKLMEDLHQPQLVRMDGRDVLITPRGVEVHSVKKLLEEYRTAPERRRGTAMLTSLDSFIAHVVRFADADSVVFANRDPAKPSLTAVLDYHRAGAEAAPRFGGHRAHYAFPLAEPWTAWAAIDGEVLSHTDFAEFLEDRIGDVLVPPEGAGGPEDRHVLALRNSPGGTFAGPSRLLELSRTLKVNEESRVTSAQNLSSGEVQLQFETAHRDEAGAPLRVPNRFLLGIPVFDGGAAYRFAARLRYRLAGGNVSWIVQRHRPDLVFEDALMEACNKAAEATKLPLLFGQPE